MVPLSVSLCAVMSTLHLRYIPSPSNRDSYGYSIFMISLDLLSCRDSGQHRHCFLGQGREIRRTRGHGVTLAKKQYRLDIRKVSFLQRTVNEWNRLSADCVAASSINIF